MDVEPKEVSAAVARGRVARLRAAIGIADAGRLDVLLDVLGQRNSLTIGEVRSVMFAGATEANANTAIRRLVANFNRAAVAGGVDITLVIRGAKKAGQGRTLGFVARVVPIAGSPLTEFEATKDRLITDRTARVVSPEPRLHLIRRGPGRVPVRVFLSWASANKRVVEELCELLNAATAVDRIYEFAQWRCDEQLLAGDDWDSRIRAAMAEADIGILALSNEFLRSEYIADVELPEFTGGKAVDGKRAVPVLLNSIAEHADLRGLDERQIFASTDSHNKRLAFSAARSKKREWANALAGELHRILDRYAEIVDADSPSDESVQSSFGRGRAVSQGAAIGEAFTSSDPIEGSLSDFGDSKAYESDPRDRSDVGSEDCLLFDPDGPLDHEARERPVPLIDFDRVKHFGARNRARHGGVNPDHTGRLLESALTQTGGDGVDALDELERWAVNPTTSLAAVLGEYGMGKTITCQAFSSGFRERRAAGEAVPVVHYFDLRELTNLRTSRQVPTLEAMIDEVIIRSWPQQGDRLATATDLIAASRTEPTIFVFDGLDEALVHLNESDGVAFTRALLKLRPQHTRSGVAAAFAGTHTKVLISCRTHYFRTLRDQARHFTEQGRDRAGVDDYLALVLLPFTDEQIREYLRHAVPERDADQLMAMLKDVHDLTELTSRPFTLAKVAEQIPAIEDRRLQGLPVHNSTIYERMVLDWLTRDEGKHQLNADHKLALMARLAAWAWRRGGRLIESRHLEGWLHEQLEEPEFSRRYALIDKDKLEEDLRTATFVVREDTAKMSGFRFAHSSIQEFFLARYLVDAIEAGQRERWVLPMPSNETLDFLGQLIDEHPGRDELLRKFGTWRGPYLEGASELYLAFALRAGKYGWPAPGLAGIDLAGANLRDIRFAGEQGSPLPMAGAMLSRADARGSDWEYVDLSRADLTDALFDRATMHCVRAADAAFERASFSGAFLRQCSFTGALSVEQLDSARVVPRVPDSGRDEPKPASCEVSTLGGHTGGVRGCAIDPAGRWAITTSQDATARVWDTTTWETITTLTGHTDGVRGCAIDPAGKWAITTSQDATARVWDTTTWETITTLTGHTDGVRGCAIDPAGKWAITTSQDATARVWDTTTWKTITTLTGHTSWAIGCAVDPAGRWAITTSTDGTARVWDTTTWKTITTLTGHTDGVWGCAVDPAGRWAITTGDDRTARVWDSTTWDAITTITAHGAGVWACAIDPTGRWAITTSPDATANVFDTSTWETITTLTGHTASLWGCAIDPSGQWAIATSTDGTAWVWDTTTWQTITTLTGHTAGLWGCAIDTTGRLAMTTGQDARARVWDTTTWQTIATLTGHTNWVVECAVDPIGRWALTTSTDGTARVWDTTTWQTITTLTGHTNWVQGCAIDPAGGWVITTSGDGTARVWDTTTWQTITTLTGHTDRVWGCAIDPAGRWVITTSDDRTARVWDTTTWQTITTLTGHTRSVRGCAIDPTGTWAITTSTDATACVWDTATWEPAVTLWHEGALGEASCAVADQHLLYASEHAWRWLRVLARNNAGKILGSFPYEHFHPTNGSPRPGTLLGHSAIGT
jgi:WD40 repeat protein